MHSRVIFRTLFAHILGALSGFCLLVGFSEASGEELPLFELGLGLGGIHQPYYVGSSQQRTIAFPVPLPIYRGSIFKSDDQGTRADLLQNSVLDLDLSAEFNFPIDSDDVDLREGMDDIGSVLQLGPSLEVKLHKSEQAQWSLGLPLRASFELSEDGVEERGFTFSPTLFYTRQFAVGQQKWRGRASLGASFATNRYHDLYYGVREPFAAQGRRQYEAGGGFAGLRAQLSFRSLNRKRLWVGFIRYDDLQGAAFDDSPLVETTGSLTVGFIYARMLWRSRETVSRDPNATAAGGL